MDNTIDTLQIEIESSTTDAQRGLTKLKNSLQKLKEMSDSVGNISNDGVTKLKAIADGVDALAKVGESGGLKTAVSELQKLSKLDFSNLGAGAEKISQVAAKVSDISNNTPTSTIAPTISTKTVDIAPSVDVQHITADLEKVREAGMRVSTSLKSFFSSAFRGIATIGKWTWETLTGSLRLFVKSGISLIKGFGKTFAKVFGGLGRTIGTATKKMGGFVRSLGRIAMYRVIRFILSQITQAFKDGTNNIYQFSKAIGGELATSMDRIASSFLYFKNSIGAMVAPIINALAPAIEMIIDKVVNLINYLNQLFAKLTGASSWTKAVKTQTEYAESTKEAAEAAESLTAGFDELNVFSDTSSKDNPATDYGSMFEEVQLDNNFASWLDQIKEYISNGDWAGLGTMLGEKINEAISSIDFAGIGSRLGEGIQSAFEFLYAFLTTVNFDQIGAGISTLLNNAMYKIDFNLVGRTLAAGINSIIGFAYGLVATFDWSQYGLSLANGINGFCSELDLSKAVETLQTAVLGLIETIEQAITNTDWVSIGGKVADGINTIDWVSIFSDTADLLSDTATGAFDLVLGFTYELDWKKLGTDLWDCLVGVVTNIDWNGLVSKAFELLGAAFGGLSQFMEGLLMSIWEVLTGAWASTKSFFDKSITEAGGDIGTGLLNGIAKIFVNIGSWINTNIFTPFLNGFKKMFGIHSPSTVMAEQGTFLTEGMLEGLMRPWHKVESFFREKLLAVKEIMTSTWSAIKETTERIWNGIVTAITNVVNKITTVVSNMVSSVLNAVRSVVNALSNIGSFVSNAFGAAKDFVSGTVGKIAGAVGSIFGFADGGFPEVGQLFIAREAGAEMVGSIGGRTAVANNDQIVQGIYEGVLAAMQAAGGSSGGNFDVNVYLDGKQVTAAVEKRQRERGATIYPGGVLYGV